MKNNLLKRALATAAFGVALSVGSVPASAAQVVNLELALMADVSGSLDALDFQLQRDGYVAAFRNASVQSSIAALSNGIAVTLVYWSDSAVQTIGWTHITGAASANAFADAIAAAARPAGIGIGTGMTNALNFTSSLFVNNGFEGGREVIDVSGDGAESNVCSSFALVCGPLQTARDAFLAGGPARTINALWIDDRNFFGDDPEDSINALLYGTTNVLGGPGAFQAIAQDFTTFEQEIVKKIGKEITPTPTPEPGTLALLGLGLFALGVSRRKVA